MFFRYQWCCLCFLPTLFFSLSGGIGDLPSRVSPHFQYKLRKLRSFCSGGAHAFVMWLGVVVHPLFKRIGWRVVEFTMGMVFCHLTKKHSHWMIITFELSVAWRGRGEDRIMNLWIWLLAAFFLFAGLLWDEWRQRGGELIHRSNSKKKKS